MMLPKQTEYKVGMYMHLSHDDERAGESLSIENQRTILTKYIEEKTFCQPYSYCLLRQKRKKELDS